MSEMLILVDKNDNAIGIEEKVKCHLPNGKLHRAFTALIFDIDGNLVLTKRSGEKMLWPGDWDGTVASHPRKDENYVSSAERRMPEEIGISCKMDYLFKFEYHVPYKNIGSENEICGTLLGIVGHDQKFNLIPEEISETRWINPEQLSTELKNQPQIYCPWMLIALFLLSESNNVMLQKYQKILQKWMNPKLQEILEESIKYHIPDNNWRLVN